MADTIKVSQWGPITIKIVNQENKIWPFSFVSPVVTFKNGANITLNVLWWVLSFNARTGVVTSQSWDYSAVLIDYDDAAFTIGQSNVQGAIDYILSNIPSSVVSSFNTRTWSVVSIDWDYNASQIVYDNVASGSPSNRVQWTIDWIDGRIDNLESIGRFRWVHDASSGSVPTPWSSTVLPLQPINSWDYWRVSIWWTIPWLQGESQLEVGDIILANIANATNPWDFTGLNTSSWSDIFTTTVALSVWSNIINHNLWTQYNIVTVINQTTWNEVNFIGKNSTNSNQLTLNTLSAFTAKVIIRSGLN